MKPFLSFGVAFLFRIVIPGVFGTLCLAPLVVYMALKLNIYDGLTKSIFLAQTTLALGIGLLVSFLDDTICKVFEGYIFWPQRIRQHLIQKLNSKIRSKYQLYKKTEDEVQKQMLNEWLMQFPFKEERKRGEPETQAVLPTRFGNILSSYEQYPKSRYGISGVFFWPRFWLVVDRDTRREISSIWSEADCVTYLSFISMGSARLYLVASFLDMVNFPTKILGLEFGSVDHFTLFVSEFSYLYLLGIGIIQIILFYVLYRVSLPLHYKNGTYFQSVFDIHRAKVKACLHEDRFDFDLWHNTWAYLNYKLVKCYSCNEFYESEAEKCSKCGAKSADSMKS